MTTATRTLPDPNKNKDVEEDCRDGAVNEELEEGHPITTEKSIITKCCHCSMVILTTVESAPGSAATYACIIMWCGLFNPFAFYLPLLSIIS